MVFFITLTNGQTLLWVTGVISSRTKWSYGPLLVTGDRAHLVGTYTVRPMGRTMWEKTQRLTSLTWIIDSKEVILRRADDDDDDDDDDENEDENENEHDYDDEEEEEDDDDDDCYSLLQQNYTIWCIYHETDICQ